MGVREFRAAFSSLDHPVTVVRTRGKMEILGTWTPAPRTPPKVPLTGQDPHG